MGGIVFFGTQKIGEIREFYHEKCGCQLWYNQGDCIILRHGNILFGFCKRDHVDTEGIITFFYDRLEGVDSMFKRFEPDAHSPPVLNEKYDIYHFFTNDPEGRSVEFQYFNHPIESHLTGDELLLSRRSIRDFKDKEVTDEVIEKILEVCRYSPTSMNTQSYYFKVIRDRELLHWLSETRGESSGPIGRAPLAVAICSDPSLSRRHVQDGCIAAYHFILTAHFFGLGTCWIAALDREDVKKKMDIPKEHYVATITPLGYPEEPHVPAPERKALTEFVR